MTPEMSSRCMPSYQRVVEKLALLVAHIRDKQAEKDVETLNLGGEKGFFHAGTVEHLIYRPVDLSYLHDVDAVL